MDKAFMSQTKQIPLESWQFGFTASLLSVPARISIALGAVCASLGPQAATSP